MRGLEHRGASAVNSEEMIPQLVFQRSWLYDEALKRERRFVKPPSGKLFRNRMLRYRKLWEKDKDGILKELPRVTKIKWSEPYITVYVTWGVYPYSNPLTVNITTPPSQIVHFLTHELIHRILSLQKESPKKEKNWERLMRKYKQYPQITRTHIVVHAIHEHILRKFFGVRQLESEKKIIKNKAYILAWHIVERDGYKNIINEFTRGV